ncbi:DUF4280 domain-containing protein [Chryseobacterium caseinilyticum]|uniref:DUF4280 domain-containing protein n=1 Tax=Chryseobacterium caseinilyticum TaxID=2771428 RepID=A0ABR8ZFV5_9FLAO|nr:DUF4280 domain-containing protein [Chryseobacterium caseinilyticum]MBD8084127.1 DUF4280 domain-containing protein [Chryseobacterium caseinilyticum]
MKTYITKPNDSFAEIAKKFQIKDELYLKTYHNLNCSTEDLIHGEIPAGTQILIPDNPQFLFGKPSTESDQMPEDESDEVNSDNGFDDQSDNLQEEENSIEDKNEKDATNDKKEGEKESSPSDHDGKYFVIQKGMCQCNQGFKFPKFKVTSHQKHYWNDAAGEADYLAVTEDDLTFEPAATPFGNCKLKPTSGGYLPCTYAPAGKWTKTYDKVKVMGKSCVTEISELMCSTGGKITIFKHGQQSEIGKSNINKADSQEQHVYNPLVDFEEFREDLEDNNEPHAW